MSIYSSADTVTSGTSISSGALLRFLNQAYGPAEIMRTSYGFTQQEVYDTKNEAHQDDMVTPFHDETDGKDYVKDCLRYVALKVRQLTPRNLKLGKQLTSFDDRATLFLLEGRSLQQKSHFSVRCQGWMTICMLALNFTQIIRTTNWKTIIR